MENIEIKIILNTRAFYYENPELSLSKKSIHLHQDTQKIRANK